MMTDIDCPHEHEVTEALAAGRWPGASAADVVAHTASCAVCHDIVAVAEAIRDDADRGRAEARIPPPGLVWWRAQLRARHRVADAADRPIAYVQALAGAVATGLFFTLGGLLWPWLRASVDVINAVSATPDMARLWVPVAVAIGASLVLAPVLALLVLSDE